MISFVIPVYNEEESIEALYKRLLPVAVKLDRSYEIIFVDDGSHDASLALLKTLEKKDTHVRIFSFRRNQGKAEALTWGFQHAIGEYIVTLDADLQDQPEEIRKLLAKAKEGYEVVCGWRRNRKDSFYTNMTSKLFNGIIQVVWKLKLHDYNCGLKLYTNDAAKSLHLYGGMHRFIPLLANEQGFAVTEVAIVHAVRQFGKSKYSKMKMFKDLPDMFTIMFLTRFGKRPLHLFGLVGGLSVFIGVCIIAFLTYLHFFYRVTVGTRPLWSIGITFILFGAQILFTGFIADLVINIHHTPRPTIENMHMFLRYSTKTTNK